MRTTFFYWYQAAAWLLVFAVITGSILISRGLAQFEIYFASALIGTSALYSFFIRAWFKKSFQDTSIGLQIIYFVVQSVIGASLASSALIITIFGFSYAKAIPTLPTDNLYFILNSLFWGNWFNMLAALIFWSAAYLVIINARQVYAVKEALSSAQLEALSQQLNPHFLFNTLNNIRAVILEDPEKARNALAQLSDMLRYSLKQHQEAKVSIADELGVTEEYIALCKIHFDERLVFESEVAKQAEQALIPRMLLQLCVENAVKHGVAKLRQGGTISLRVYLTKNKDLTSDLVIEVINPIASSDTIDEALDPDFSHQQSAGLGIKNIKQRLQLLYGNRAKLVMSKKGSKIQVVITLPFEETPKFSEDKDE